MLKSLLFKRDFECFLTVAKFKLNNYQISVAFLPIYFIMHAKSIITATVFLVAKFGRHCAELENRH